jgi:hypothetical protein
MFCFPLTNWTTMRGATSVTTITQSESQWLDLTGFEDIITWLEVKNLTPGGGTGVTLQYQTSPTKDEALFAGTAAAFAMTTGVTVTKALMSAATVPLARWLRWQLGSGGATASWDATFRLWIAANIGPHPLRPKINPPSIRPNGKSCNGDCQKGGSKPIAGMTIGDVVTQRQLQLQQQRPATQAMSPSRFINSNIVNPKYFGPTPR